jgi:hypothetical protein
LVDGKDGVSKTSKHPYMSPYGKKERITIRLR